MVLIMGHNLMFFYGKIWLTVATLSLLLPFIWTTDVFYDLQKTYTFALHLHSLAYMVEEEEQNIFLYRLKETVISQKTSHHSLSGALNIEYIHM